MSTKVFIIDDDDVVHFMHETLLKMGGINIPVLSFLNGKKAYEYITEHCKHGDRYLLLLDINMPEMNGWQLLEKLQQLTVECEIKTLLITSSVDSEDHLMAKKYSSVINFIEKPLTTDHIDELKKKLNSFLFH